LDSFLCNGFIIECFKYLGNVPYLKDSSIISASGCAMWFIHIFNMNSGTSSLYGDFLFLKLLKNEIISSGVVGIMKDLLIC